HVAREKARLMTLTLLKRGEDERAIFNQWSTDRTAILRARKGWLSDGREWIARLKTFVAQEAEKVTAPIIRPALGHHVYDPARRAAELWRKGVGDHLKLLHGFLADGRARRVYGIIRVVGAINLNQVGTTALAAEIQA